MKMKKIIVVAATLLSFLLITVTALAMQSSSEKQVNNEPTQPSIIRSATLPGGSNNENVVDNSGEAQLSQTYTEVNPNSHSVTP